ncbi:MAG: DUF4383 domain-containing protein [Sporichthyaceae bacterium]
MAPAEIRENPNAVVGAAVGAGYLLAGVVASAITTGSYLATSPGHHADGLGGVHCAMYAVVGLLLLVGIARGRARLVNTLVGGAYVVLGLALLPVADAPQLLALHEADNLVHLVSAALLFGFGRTQE